ncbi:flagellar protein FlgN [Paenibacillus chibensis]|uniref:flagellar protein FlgN n=1 Tax=Paenibacillus chibensis TaxID=59846 RepID=UPI000FD7B8DC|nr:flagellar protein FlgN [Paenibacillus chibensis]MEC0370810.1 flagellar protein FlgN [Paenibacillus chibensis]
MPIQTLIETLSRLNELHKELLQVAEHKKQAVIHNRYEDITAALTKESRLLKSVKEYEEKVYEEGQAFIAEKGIKSKLKLTISEISRLVFEPEEKAKLLEVQRDLTFHLTELKRVNTHIQELIQQSLSYIDFSLNLMVGAMDEEATYSRPEQSTRGIQRSGLFDTRA